MSSFQENVPFFDGFLLGTEFKEYLDKSGSLYALNNVLESLWNEPEWPSNPQQYIQSNLAVICGLSPDPILKLKETREKLQNLKRETEEQRKKVSEKFALEAAARKHKERNYK